MRSCWARSSKYHHQTLLQSPEALEYLQRRGIGHEEAIRTFKLGTVKDCVRASKAARRALDNSPARQPVYIADSSRSRISPERVATTADAGRRPGTNPAGIAHVLRAALPPIPGRWRHSRGGIARSTIRHCQSQLAQAQMAVTGQFVPVRFAGRPQHLTPTPRIDSDHLCSHTAPRSTAKVRHSVPQTTADRHA
jgi:hypothetical protein